MQVSKPIAEAQRDICVSRYVVSTAMMRVSILRQLHGTFGFNLESLYDARCCLCSRSRCSPVKSVYSGVLVCAVFERAGQMPKDGKVVVKESKRV